MSAENYEHKKIVEAIQKNDAFPQDPTVYSEWVKGDAHLEFLRINALADDIVVNACGDYTFVHSFVVSNDQLTPIDRNDLLSWNCNSYTGVASYVSGGGREGIWIERGQHNLGAKSLEGAIQLIFTRTFEGMTGSGRTYQELCQEYAHLTGIHWRPEKRAYCRYNGSGDMEAVVSITNHEDKKNGISLATFKRQPLEEYLAASNSSLVRLFDFTLLRRSGFSGWSKAPEEDGQISADFFFKRKNDGSACYTRGVQILTPRRSKEVINKSHLDSWFGQNDKKYVEFLAWDWRNQKIANISTDPAASTNYFVAKENSLPFELSPAFFKPEVLSKYKSDRDKYTIEERAVSCRSAWHLKGIDVNEAGQVHAYICDLRRLPYAEQLHWFSFNEPPKTGISRRAFTTDFEGNYSDIPNPVGKVRHIAQQWDGKSVPWWTLRDGKLIERVNTPLTASRDEWAEAFMDLAKLIIEGFETDHIRKKLDQLEVSYAKDDRTLGLLEKLLCLQHGEIYRLERLRDVQNIRSKVKGHASGKDAEKLAQEALLQHETFSAHFRYVCEGVVEELEAIERAFKGKEDD